MTTMITPTIKKVGERCRRAVRRRSHLVADLGQAGLVTVIAFSLLASVVGVVIVQQVVSSDPLYQTRAVEIYAHRALEAGQNAYITAINANPSLAQCNTGTNSSGTCGGINYGQWNVVNGSNASGADLEYYSFGNPQPTFDPGTKALTSLSVQVVGAAYDPNATNNYLFVQETMSVTPSNGFLQNVWWSNYESYNGNGDYSHCNYNWKLNYNINAGGSTTCGPVYFGPNDYLFGPVYTNDSVFVSPRPDFGTSNAPSTVTTADPHCLFVDNTHGMNGSYTGNSSCTNVGANDVGNFDTTNSSSNHTVEQPPANDTQLGIIASQNGCLYSGPTQITLSTSNGVGQMTVISPDTTEQTKTINGNSVTWDTSNIASNANNCPNNGTAPLPANGVVFVQNASTGLAWANPFDDPTYNSATNVTSNPSSPVKNNAVTLTATVTSGSSTPDVGATVAFSQTTKSGNQTSTNVIGSCASQSLSSPVAVTPATSPPTYTSTATCSTTESNSGTGAFSAVYSGGNNATSSSGNLGQTNPLNSSTSYGPDAQVTQGGCTACYYGQSPSPNAEGDAFVNGSLSGQLTIGTANNVIIDGNITYADCANTWTTGQSGSSAPSQGLCPYSVTGTNDVLGLIANNYVEVNRPLVASTSNQGNPTVEPSCGANPGATCDPSDGTNGITIDAAILALTQSFVVNNYDNGGSEGPLLVYGSIQQFARGPVGTFNGTSLVSGYVKHYTWDPLLTFVAPPSYLVPSTPSWVLAGVTTDAGAGSTSTCPPLLPVYGSSQPVVQYCSASPGGLPNFPPMTAPSSPTNVHATSNANGTVTVTWTDPQTDNGSAISGYTIAPSPLCAGCAGTSVTGAGTTSTTISGLTRRSWYNFTVTATNGLGSSNPSIASNSVIAPDVPTSPTNASATTNQDGSITVTWTDPSDNGSPITSYGITPAPACGSCTYSNLSGANRTSATVSGVTPGGTYTFTVSATNGVGTGASSTVSNSVVAPNVPGVPTIGTATRGAGSAVVNWTAPSVTNGSSIIGYVVTPYLNGSTPQSAQTFVSTATSQTVNGLNNGSAYTFKVAATNGVGTGTQSAASNSVTPATTPGAPTIGTATAGAGSASVAFTAPGSNGGSAITSYTVTAKDTTNSSRGGQTTTGAGSPLTVTGLTAGDSYTFTVTATNAVGTSTASGASNSVTTPTVPGTPAKPSASKIASGQIKVTWTAPSNGGSAITGYIITPSSGSPINVGNVTTYTVTGLTANKGYTFTVTAVNAVGNGIASPASSSVTA